MPDLIVYPDAHVETDTVDGDCRHSSVAGSLSWHEIVTAAGSNSTHDSNLAHVMIWARTLGNDNKWRECSRIVTLFKTAALPDICTISAVTLQVWVVSKFDGLPCTPTLGIYASAPNNDDTVTAGDYALARWGNTILSDIMTYAGITAGAWNTFTLNAAGRALISKTGITRLGIRNENYDVADELDPNNHDPTWNSNNDSFIQINTADEAGKAPILTVTYNIGGGAVVVGPGIGRIGFRIIGT